MKKNIFITLSVMVALVVFVAATHSIAGLKVGDTAKDFKLKNIDGKMISLSDFKDAKGFIINFTCNACPFAVLYQDRVVEMQSKYGKSYPVINIMPNDVSVKPEDDFQHMQERAKEVGYQYYLLDAKQEVVRQFGAERTPHVYVLDRNLKVRYIGAIDDNPQNEEDVKINYVTSAIKAIENGKEPEPSFTKAIGCSIKFKK